MFDECVNCRYWHIEDDCHICEREIEPDDLEEDKCPWFEGEEVEEDEE
jgi:methionyl-tRNA synthetase